jgi:hypothetical protein
MYGNIDVEILEYNIGDSFSAVTPASPFYTVSDSEYRNVGLGFSIQKPSGFVFTKLDAVYPDFTILEAQQGSTKVTVSLLEVFPELRTTIALNEIAPGVTPRAVSLDGRDAVIVSTTEKARLLSRAGESVWMITVESPHPEELMHQFLAGWHWIPAK